MPKVSETPDKGPAKADKATELALEIENGKRLANDGAKLPDDAPAATREAFEEEKARLDKENKSSDKPAKASSGDNEAEKRDAQMANKKPAPARDAAHDRDEGRRLARNNQELPEGASDAMRETYEAEREQIRNVSVRTAENPAPNAQTGLQNPAGGNFGVPGVSPLTPDNPDTPENEVGKPNQNPDSPENETPRGRPVVDPLHDQPEIKAGKGEILVASNNPGEVDLGNGRKFHARLGKQLVSDPDTVAALKKYIADRQAKGDYSIFIAD
jgi:hypothetical protein